MESLNAGETPGQVVTRNGVPFYKIIHRHGIRVAGFSNLIKNQINNILNDRHYYVVVNFMELDPRERTSNFETHITEMKIWLKNDDSLLTDEELDRISQLLQGNVHFNQDSNNTPAVSENPANCDERWKFSYIDNEEECGRHGDFDENNDSINYFRLYCDDSIPLLGNTNICPPLNQMTQSQVNQSQPVENRELNTMCQTAEQGYSNYQQLNIECESNNCDNLFVSRNNSNSFSPSDSNSIGQNMTKDDFLTQYGDEIRDTITHNSLECQNRNYEVEKVLLLLMMKI